MPAKSGELVLEENLDSITATVEIINNQEGLIEAQQASVQSLPQEFDATREPVTAFARRHVCAVNFIRRTSIGTSIPAKLAAEAGQDALHKRCCVFTAVIDVGNDKDRSDCNVRLALKSLA